jgi:ABC-type antimicrobial peptide transport system permease subunit
MRLHHKLYGWLQANTAKVDLITMLLAFAVLALPLLAANPAAFVLSAAQVAPLAWRRTRVWASGALIAAVCLGARSALGVFGDVVPSLPWLQLAAVLAVAVAAGLLASVLPARRAARLSPVEGLATT